MPKHCIFAESFLIVGYKVLYERACSLLLSQSAFKQLLWKNLTNTFCQHLEQLLKHCISAKLLLIEDQVKGALRKYLLIAPFVVHFNTATLGKSY